jgi:hypothetical protein
MLEDSDVNLLELQPQQDQTTEEEEKEIVLVKDNSEVFYE